MKKWNSLSLNKKVSLINLFTGTILFVLTIPFFFFKLSEIPLSILLGGMFNFLIYLLFDVLDNKKLNKTVIFIIIKSVLFMGIIALFSYLYFSKIFRLFNPFIIASMYLLSIVIFVIVNRKDPINE